MPKQFLLVIAGPTAVGKTELCVRLANYFHTEIISADSRQFYKEMSIGTAKPTKEEMDGIRHHFIDSISIHEQYDVGKYEKEALQVISEIHTQHNLTILTGGSGLFIKAVCDGFDDLPKAPNSVRDDVLNLYSEKGLLHLQELLHEKDDLYYKKVDLNNPQRLMRALEVIQFTGKPFSSFRKGIKKHRPFKTIKIILNREREELYDRINKRMDIMLTKGLIEEAKELYPLKEMNALQTVGYQELFKFWDGEYDWEETKRLLKQNSRRYAKRQLTWFRKDPEFKWFHPNEYQEIVNHIESELKK